MKRCRPIFQILVVFASLSGLSVQKGWSQRSYQENSVLASGNWFKFSVDGPGIYKLDLAFLAKLGLNTSGLSSSSIRLFGNGGAMLPEAANGPRIDDLAENAVWIEDGGDGVLNGADYLLFYSPGPHQWLNDSVQKTSVHQKNVFSEKSYYYISAGGIGKRVGASSGNPVPTITVNTFNIRYFHELDTVNFLSSGKQWYGEEFSSMPGRVLSRTFSVSLPGWRNEAASLRVNTIARSIGTPSSFSIGINSQQVMQIEIPPVSNGAYDLFAQTVQSAAPFSNAGNQLAVQFTYTTGSFGSQGWLNWFEIHGRGNLAMSGNQQLSFHDWNSLGPGNIGRFVISDASAAVQVWEVTNHLAPIRMNTALTGTDLQFVNDCSSFREYIAFTAASALLPAAIGKVNNQDLHKSAPADMLVVTHPLLLAQANRLAQYHRDRDGLQSVVVTTDQVFNEFSSGIGDPTAIRDFVKMYYDRAGSDTTKRPRFLLLFGDGSFDYKDRIRNNTNLVPAFESDVSLDPLSTYTSDDFFGFLDDVDDINGNGVYLLDIGIGRIPAADEASAKAIVDKIISYHTPLALGPWRNEITFVADDEDANLHLQDAETISGAAKTVAPVFNADKIYLDAYRQEGGSGGSRYPDVNQAINSKFYNGTLIWNYTGHGGFRRLAEEVVLDQEIINGMNNALRLPLFITATCDVAPYDNPLISSIGENLLLREKTGAIALMTTTRLVFAFSNRVMNENYIRSALRRKADSTYPALGEAVRMAKNHTYTFFSDVINNRKFTLLGDPALTIGLPPYQVKTTLINDKPLTAIPDTLKALDSYSIAGEVYDASGNLLPNFNGTVYPVVYDKVHNKQTKANDPGSLLVSFPVQENVLFRGKAKVENGKFVFKFIVPKDINYVFGNGRLAYYTENGIVDGNGQTTSIIVGGTGTGNGDVEGPRVRAWMNDEKFVSGSITNNAPVLLLKLTDSSGVNIMGTGIGHDLVAMLDNDPDKIFILNQFYESDLDNFQKGTVRYQMPVMEEGLHTLTIKAWDVMNNSSEISLDFQVVKPTDLVLDHVLNYPNPFTTNTTFWFEHNRPNEEMAVFVQIYTVSGKLVKTLRETIFSTGNRSNEVSWDGRDEYGSKLARGVYIYRLRVRLPDGKSAEKWEKLYIL